MEKCRKYRIVPALNLVIEYYSGSTGLQDLIEFKKEISSDNDYHPEYNLIMDFRHSELVGGEAEVNQYIEFVRSYPKIYGRRRAAYLTSKPKEVAITILFTIQKDDLPIEPEVFSSLKAVTDWLGYSAQDYNRIRLLIRDLQEKESYI